MNSFAEGRRVFRSKIISIHVLKCEIEQCNSEIVHEDKTDLVTKAFNMGWDIKDGKVVCHHHHTE